MTAGWPTTGPGAPDTTRMRGMTTGICRIIAITLLVAGLAGCGPRPPVMVPVSGTVSYSGTPIADGSITFAARDGSTAPNVLKITEGRYEGRVVIGDKRIEVRAMRKVKRSDGPLMGPVSGPGVEEGPALMNFIPAAYNDASTLTRLIEPPGPVTVDLDLAAER